MTEYENERHVYQKDDPGLFERVEKLVFAGETEIDVEGKSYSVAQGDDDAKGSYYVLAPKR